MEKQQFIHNKWSDLGIILLQSQYDFDGWIDVNELEKNQITSELEYKKYKENDIGHETMLCRPKSLKGIENNNGWVKIYCENDMPQFDCHCFIIDKEKGLVSGLWKQAPNEIEDKIARSFWLEKATHYKIISEPNLPLY